MPSANNTSSIQIINLGSGSGGNSSLICHEGKILMVDCGFSRKQLVKRMGQFGLNPNAVCGILISHEHGDHVKGLRVFSKENEARIFATEGTINGSGLTGPRTSALTFGVQVAHCGFEIKPLSISHDTRQPCAFLVTVAGLRSLFVTDLGTDEGLDTPDLGELDFLFVEANHDEKMLKDGPYPAFLKKRIAGNGGHLSNKQCGKLVGSLAKKSPNLKSIMLAHLSDKNNNPEKALSTVIKGVGSLPDVSWLVAKQDEPQSLSLNSPLNNDSVK